MKDEGKSVKDEKMVHEWTDKKDNCMWRLTEDVAGDKRWRRWISQKPRVNIPGKQ